MDLTLTCITPLYLLCSALTCLKLKHRLQTWTSRMFSLGPISVFCFPSRHTLCAVLNSVAHLFAAFVIVLFVSLLSHVWSCFLFGLHTLCASVSWSVFSYTFTLDFTYPFFLACSSNACLPSFLPRYASFLYFRFCLMHKSLTQRLDLHITVVRIRSDMEIHVFLNPWHLAWKNYLIHVLV